jgi:hypothetical protein
MMRNTSTIWANAEEPVLATHEQKRGDGARDGTIIVSGATASTTSVGNDLVVISMISTPCGHVLQILCAVRRLLSLNW